MNWGVLMSVVWSVLLNVVCFFCPGVACWLIRSHIRTQAYKGWADLTQIMQYKN